MNTRGTPLFDEKARGFEPDFSGQTVAVDFDAVLHPYKEWDGPEARGGPPIAGARKALVKLRAAGHPVLVFTSRPKTDVVAWLAAHDLLDLVDTIQDGKPLYVALFDDRAHNVEPNKPHALLRAVHRYLHKTDLETVEARR